MWGYLSGVGRGTLTAVSGSDSSFLFPSCHNGRNLCKILPCWWTPPCSVCPEGQFPLKCEPRLTLPLNLPPVASITAMRKVTNTHPHTPCLISLSEALTAFQTHYLIFSFLFSPSTPDIGFHVLIHVGLNNLKLTVTLLPQLPKCWYCRCTQPCSAWCVIFT